MNVRQHALQLARTDPTRACILRVACANCGQPQGEPCRQGPMARYSLMPCLSRVERDRERLQGALEARFRVERVRKALETFRGERVRKARGLEGRDRVGECQLAESPELPADGWRERYLEEHRKKVEAAERARGLSGVTGPVRDWVSPDLVAGRFEIETYEVLKRPTGWTRCGGGWRRRGGGEVVND